LSEIEAEEAVGSFVECPVNIHHAEELSNMFTGNLGSVRDLWVDGEWVKGEVAIPLWLDNQLTDDGKKLSAEWTLTDKRFVGLALTPTPRIDNAALMAAFKNSGKSQTPDIVPPKDGRPAAKSGERNLRMNLQEAIAKFTAFLKAEGVTEFTSDPVVPTPATAPAEDKEKAELAQFKANMVAEARVEAEKAAVMAFGTSASFTAAKATIAATEDIALLKTFKSSYESIAKQIGINAQNGRQTAVGGDLSDGEFVYQAPKLENPGLMKFALEKDEDQFAKVVMENLTKKGLLK
ncbi:MAG: hypothetical protein EBR82_46305, partial [Caulobacteraceae bacterium]|nr:hypothetical protein [Caulobacteraceae bacterium]